ncbi:hypothetical protein CYMTET_13944 [Cymbomonas tetramitiformis]|uniref:Uncharacterized protein n=1 Tax=Cymbomonas tetramitiformis TaxID=36881 RepID=A0AAE0GHC7_9CHLO|nr:hypothetical protein CYMTET_13944 [Cymbomonas tetramitiformis]
MKLHSQEDTTNRDGLMSAHLGASHIVLTDCTEESLDLARKNVRLCSEADLILNADMRMSVHHLRWEQDLGVKLYLHVNGGVDAPKDIGEPLDQNALFDVVLGSDLVYSIGHAGLLPRVIMRRLRPGGTAIIVTAIRNSTHHDEFVTSCRETRGLCNLKIQWKEVQQEFYSEEDAMEEEDFSRGFLIVTFTSAVEEE